MYARLTLREDKNYCLVKLSAIIAMIPVKDDVGTAIVLGYQKVLVQEHMTDIVRMMQALNNTVKNIEEVVVGLDKAQKPFVMSYGEIYGS